MEKKRRKIYRMIDCGHVSELSKEEKEHAMNMLRFSLVHNHFSGDCIVRVEKRAWVIDRRLAMLKELLRKYQSNANYNMVLAGMWFLHAIL